MAIGCALLAAQPGRIVVADRGAGTLTIIPVATDLPATIQMPAGAQKPEPMYVVYSPIHHRLFVGDRANNRVVVFHAKDFSLLGAIPVGTGVFHMWASNLCQQLWVVNDGDKTLTVIDTVSLNVVRTIPLPADLMAQGGRPHDVILDPIAPYAYVSMVGLPGASDYVLKYSTVKFAEMGRVQVGKDPHLSLTWRNNLLYVPCQGSSQLHLVDRRTMTARPPIAIPGTHGAGMAMGRPRFYTTNFTSTAGGNGLFAIDTQTNTVLGSAPVPFSTPHNIVVTPGGGKIYVTHSGTNQHVSVYSAGGEDGIPRLLRSVPTGLNPFGLEFVP